MVGVNAQNILFPFRKTLFQFRFGFKNHLASHANRHMVCLCIMLRLIQHHSLHTGISLLL
ncbi:Uncharacterised protein [Vibrio cholerae]|uniref:Uncharacterized protein n=1 Tax=Vibrio cholerae TaxID=666 RepID=A0A655NUC4_VIBCL|nr:Uncharacterised protein [Vibrio cholerae]